MVGELVTLPVRVGVRVTRLWFRAVEESVSVTATVTERMIALVSSRGSGGADVGTAPSPPASPTAGTPPHPSVSTTVRPSRREAPAERDKDGAGERKRPQADREHPQTRGERPQATGEGTEAPAEPTEVRDFAPPVTQPTPEASLSAEPAPPLSAEPGPSLAAEPGAPLSAEPAHVSEEPELVEEFAEPGAEEGAGAEIRVDPPWDGYERMNVKQVISRLASAGPEELATVELYEGTHRRRQTILNAVDRELRHPNGSRARAQKRG